MASKQILIDAFKMVLESFPEATRTIFYNGQEAQGALTGQTIENAQRAISDDVSSLGTVRVLADEISEPKYGDAITVGDDLRIVVSSTVDHCGAVRVIGTVPYYSEWTDVTGKNMVDGALVDVALRLRCRVLEPTLDQYSQFSGATAETDSYVVVIRKRDWTYDFEPQTGFGLSFDSRPAMSVGTVELINGDYRIMCR